MIDILTCVHEVVKNPNPRAGRRRWIYKCKCPNFRFNAYLCSHVLVALHLDGDVVFDVKHLADRVWKDPVGSGRRPKAFQPKVYQLRVKALEELEPLHNHVREGDTIFVENPKVGCGRIKIANKLTNSYVGFFASARELSPGITCQRCQAETGCWKTRAGIHLNMTENEAKLAKIKWQQLENDCMES